MKLRKRAIGDMYLAASILFIFLSFLYFGIYKNYKYGWAFLIIGLVIAFYGMKAKKFLMSKETRQKVPKKAAKKSLKKAKFKKRK